MGPPSIRHYEVGCLYPFCHDLAQFAPPSDFASLVLVDLAIQLEAEGPVTCFLPFGSCLVSRGANDDQLIISLTPFLSGGDFLFQML